MIVVMKNTATRDMVDRVLAVIEAHELKGEPMFGTQRVAIGVLGDKDRLDEGHLLRLPGVKEILRVSKPYKKVSREYKPENTVVTINDSVQFGNGTPVIIAGPCSVESEDRLLEIAENVKKLGAHMLRGGAFKPRTSPYAFQGHGLEGLKILKRVSEKTGLPIVTEILSVHDLEAFDEYVDMIQIGSRNMHNFDLITKVARLGKPMLLKRGMSATLEEFLLAAEYILNEGNDQVVLCERGIRTYEQSTRNILDLNSLALVKIISHLPIIADPSHAAGRYDIVPQLAVASLATGADGLIVEVHNEPDKALSDGKQSLTFESFDKLMARVSNLIQ
ncbi:3-deoxy-7-phosphoheptulonate synthase [Candidatus Peregrinibacteria bacterium CG_4_10_14_0_2_um_filter_43_11]|nr:MAG: 3-deoxy-7-phosphoheptulonate synthase [Candidatus Peregrinibacteria bacterium CG_4_10_14_0_2_um_filter_43_11]